MKLEESLTKLYIKLTTDEELLRLLHYKSVNGSDDPLSPLKPNILTMPDDKKWSIIDNILLPSDKKFDLDLKLPICRVCFYTATRRPQTNYNPSSRSMKDNPYVSDQWYYFDVYVHADIDIIDFRMTKILDRLNELLWGEGVTDIGKFFWSDGGVIGNTPDGFLGYRAVFHTTSLQEPVKD